MGANILLTTNHTTGLHDEHDDPPLYFFLTKMFATTFSYLTGIPGGIFAPTITVGIAFGNFLAKEVIQRIDDQVPGPLVCVMCATGYFAGVTQSPITSAAIMVGMIDMRG